MGQATCQTGHSTLVERASASVERALASEEQAMGEVVDIHRYANARDRKLLGEILQAAQLALAYATYERSFFLSSLLRIALVTALFWAMRHWGARLRRIRATSRRRRRGPSNLRCVNFFS